MIYFQITFMYDAFHNFQEIDVSCIIKVWWRIFATKPLSEPLLIYC